MVRPIDVTKTHLLGFVKLVSPSIVFDFFLELIFVFHHVAQNISNE